MKNWVLGAGCCVPGAGSWALRPLGSVPGAGDRGARAGGGARGWRLGVACRLSQAGIWLAAAALLAAVAGCTTEGAASRAREAEEKIRAQLADPGAAALAQKVSPDVVKEVQQNLLTLKEYLGEVNGQLDSVTVNAVQAFQTSAGLKADGMLNEKTRTRLREAANQKTAAQS